MQNPFVLPVIFQYIATALGFCFAGLPYIFLVWNRKIKPNLSTWLLWGLAPLSSFLVSVLSGTPGWQILVVLIAGFNPMIILSIALIRKQFYTESKWLDIICFTLAIMALAVYFTTQNVLYSQILLILVDFIGCVPLVAKIWFSKTENEPLKIFLIYILTTLLGLLTQITFDPSSSLFLFYLVVINILISISIILKKYRLRNQVVTT